MPGRITLLCHGRTTARASAFPGDEPLADGEAGRIAALVPALAGADHVLSSPAPAARQTAEALSGEAIVDPCLRDLDLAGWRGRPIAEIEASEPAALAAWLGDGDFAGHGGESRAALASRVSAWLDARLALDGHILAVTHASVIQAAMLGILGAPATAFRNLDVAPLDALDIRSDGRRWTIRSFGRS